MIKGKVNLVMDGQWGSTGKGKIVGYLAQNRDIQASICNFMTNAGHWYRDKVKGDFLVQQLPMAAINPNIRLLIGAGSAITVETLEEEIKQFESRGIPIRERLMIDRHAAIIEQCHKDDEQFELGRISSTLKGCGAALADKVKRAKRLRLAQDVPELTQYIRDTADEVYHMLSIGATVLGELAQGFDLSLNHGMRYPYVTSRDITPASFMADCGIPLSFLGSVYGVIRTFPIRVGNVKDDEGSIVGWSGPNYPDQVELSWEELSHMSGKKLLERTTVTNKIRRVFTFSMMQYEKFVKYCEPTHIALNFCNYFSGIDETSRSVDLATNRGFQELVSKVRYVGVPIWFYGTGADNDAIIDIEKS